MLPAARLARRSRRSRRSRPPLSSFPSRQRTSFPELVGRSPRQAASVISSHGLNPVIVGPNQPLSMDFRNNRVRIVTDPSGRVVAQVPNVG